MLDKNMIKELKDVSGVQTIEINPDEISLSFKEGHQRTGQELLEVQKILFDYKIFSFIKSEKVDFWSNQLIRINIIL